MSNSFENSYQSLNQNSFNKIIERGYNLRNSLKPKQTKLQCYKNRIKNLNLTKDMSDIMPKTSYAISVGKHMSIPFFTKKDLSTLKADTSSVNCSLSTNSKSNKPKSYAE